MLELIDGKPKDATEAPKDAPVSTSAPTESPKQEQVAFPALGKGPAVFYETDKHEVWIGIPLNLVGEPSFVLAAIDRAKYEALIYLQQHMISVAQRKQLEASPLGLSIKKTMTDLFGKKK